MLPAVTKLLLILAATALGCRESNKPAKQAEPAQGSAQDPGWIDRLPQLAGADTKLSLEMSAGLVWVKKDGSLYVAKPPAAAADPRHLASDPFAGATPVQIAELTKTLGIPAIVPRNDDAYAPTEGAPENPSDAHYALLGHPAQASGAPVPAKRMTSVFSLAHANDVSAGVIVFADAQAPAGTLVDVLAQTGGFLAVRHGRELGALPLAFDRHAPAAVAPDKPWTEIRLGPTIEIEAVPSKASSVPAIDKLASAVTVPAVDVLASPQTTVQDLIATIESLRAAKVEALGFGHAPSPGSADASARGPQGPRELAWDFTIQGPGDAKALRAAFDAALEPIRACYTSELAKTPDLTGTAHIQFLVPANAKVTTVNVTDVPRPLVTCVTTAIKAAKFPSPESAAGMNVLATLAFLVK